MYLSLIKSSMIMYYDMDFCILNIILYCVWYMYAPKSVQNMEGQFNCWGIKCSGLMKTILEERFQCNVVRLVTPIVYSIPQKKAGCRRLHNFLQSFRSNNVCASPIVNCTNCGTGWKIELFVVSCCIITDNYSSIWVPGFPNLIFQELGAMLWANVWENQTQSIDPCACDGRELNLLCQLHCKCNYSLSVNNNLNIKYQNALLLIHKKWSDLKLQCPFNQPLHWENLIKAPLRTQKMIEDSSNSIEDPLILTLSHWIPLTSHWEK